MQSLTFRLHDALPPPLLEAAKRRAAEADVEVFGGPHYRDEEILDAGYGACLLARQDVAAVVQDALLHWNNEKYDLVAWVIMPNHLHVILVPKPGWKLSKIVQGLKSFTARALVDVIGPQEHFWQRNYWDRYIRDGDHFDACVRYVHNNPVSAGLVSAPEQWRFSSACEDPAIQRACSPNLRAMWPPGSSE